MPPAHVPAWRRQLSSWQHNFLHAAQAVLETGGCWAGLGGAGRGWAAWAIGGPSWEGWGVVNVHLAAALLSDAPLLQAVMCSCL